MNGMAQSQPNEIRYGVIGMRALRYHPDATDASEIMDKVFQNNRSIFFDKAIKYDHYQKTSINVLANKESLESQLLDYRYNKKFIYNNVIHPYIHWMNYARPLERNPSYTVLTPFLFEEHKTFYENNITKEKKSFVNASRENGLYECIGKQNVSLVLSDIFGEIDLFRNTNTILLQEYKSPLGAHSRKMYSYKLIGTKKINDVLCYEIAFFCESQKENTFSGYFYISADGNYTLLQSKFTLNNPSDMNFVQNILISHNYVSDGHYLLPEKKTSSILLGDDVKGCLIAERSVAYSNFEPFGATSDVQEHKCAPNVAEGDSGYWKNVRTVALTPSEEQVDELIKTASESRSFITVQKLISILLNNYMPVGDYSSPIEIGPITQFINFNSHEGLRLKFGGNTTVEFINNLLLGGYVAYGFNDQKVKYRADIIYSVYPRSRYIWEYPRKLISFTYANDLNVPGENLLTTKRDDISYSFSHAAANKMSYQKVALLAYEDEPDKTFSYKIGGQYKYDEPVGIVRYMKVQDNDTSFVPNVTTSEIQLSARFSLGEKFIQTRDTRAYLNRSDFELNLSHRIGIKNLFNSKYNYHITEFKGYKKFPLGNKVNLGLNLSAGKIWNRVPLPILFIPQGNQTYVFEKEDYNCMNYFEFVTDNYVAGNLNIEIKWSPVKLFDANNNIRTNFGFRSIYGPISNNNNPESHPELYIFNHGVNLFKNTPYSETCFGFSNILKFIRIEYVRRLAYLNHTDGTGKNKVLKGSVLFTGNISF